MCPRFVYHAYLRTGSHWLVVELRSLGLGFCGCLSTVSTFVGEVVDRVGARRVKGSEVRATCGCHGPLYALATLGCACLLGLTLYTSIHDCNESNHWCHTNEAHGWKVTFQDTPGGKIEDPEESMPHHLIHEP